MKTKFLAGCIAAALMGSTALLSEAGGQGLVPGACVYDGTPPPAGDNVNHKGVAPDFWCCYSNRVGNNVVSEVVRRYPDGKVRTAIPPEPPCTVVLPP